MFNRSFKSNIIVLVKLGIKYHIFTDVESNSTFATTERRVQAMENSRHDVLIGIIASAKDASKMIRLMEQRLN